MKTDDVKSLTAAQARALVAQLSHSDDLRLDSLQSLSFEVARALSKHIGLLSLNGLTSLSDEAARQLARHGGSLYLDGLMSLSAPAALSLSRRKRDKLLTLLGHNIVLSLNGLTTLIDSVAAALAAHKGGGLLLNGLTHLSDTALFSLFEHKGKLYLNGLSSLSDQAAHMLAHRRGKISLNGLTVVSERAVDVIANRNADWLDASKVTILCPAIARALSHAERQGCLSIPGVNTLSTEAATQLADERYGLSLAGLASLSVEAATALSGLKGRMLALDGLAAATPEVCRALAVYAGDLKLDGLASIDVDAAAELARHVGDLSLGGLSTLSDAAAQALSRHKGGSLRLSGLSSISQRTAEALSRHDGDLYLPSLKEFTPAVADSLAQHSGGVLFIVCPSALNSAQLAARMVKQSEEFLNLSEVTSLSEEAATALSQSKGMLMLHGLRTLSMETARALARHLGALYLDGIKDLSAETAGALSRHAGKLSLCGLTELSETTARALAPHVGELFLDGLTKLSEEAAQQLSLHKGILHLDGLSTLSDEAAIALAWHRCGLTLLGLEKLSSTATAALDGHQIVLPDTLSRSVVSANRTVRVFISSTFRDFGVERDILVRRVFPELRRRCSERQVTLIDVDLRWGITEEESQKGTALPICLAEIDRARPFFIGMLGERYGWIPAPNQCDRSLLLEQPWLEEHLGGTSVTELEILHGVLNKPQALGRALFYFRDPAWALERGADFASESVEDADKLLKLKTLIRSHGLVTLDNYKDPEALADRVQEDLWAEIDRLYPKAVQDDDACHRAFATRQSARYVDDERRVEQLYDAWNADPSQPLVVSGPAGSGKTALLIAWLTSVQQRQGDVVVISHYLGCDADASDPSRLVVRLGKRIAAFVDAALLEDTFLTEFVKRMNNSPELGDIAIKTNALSRWLLAASEWAERNGRRIIVALDGLDLLSDAAHLQWMPRSMPSCVSLVMTARSGEAFTAAKGWLNAREIAASELTLPEREKLVRQYLQQYQKQLTSCQMQMLLDHPLSGSPFFLLTVADNLRTFGHHEQLDWWLSTLLSQPNGNAGLTAATTADVFQHVLARLETEVGREGVCSVLTTLWATRDGLAPDELFAVARVTPFTWAAIERVIDEAFVRGRGGSMLGCPYLREAVEKRYMPTPNLKAEAHRRLADYFLAKRQDERVVLELLWNLRGCSDTSSLQACLLDQRTFAVLYPEHGAEIISSWSDLAVDIDSSYESVLSQWGGCRELLDRGPPDIEPSEVRAAVCQKLDNSGDLLSLTEQLLLGTRYPEKFTRWDRITTDACGRRSQAWRSMQAAMLGISEGLFRRVEETAMAKLSDEPTRAILMLGEFLERVGCLSGFTGRLDAWRARHREIWQYSEVEPALQRALAGYERAFGRDHLDTRRVAARLARYQI